MIMHNSISHISDTASGNHAIYIDVATIADIPDMIRLLAVLFTRDCSMRLPVALRILSI